MGFARTFLLRSEFRIRVLRLSGGLTDSFSAAIMKAEKADVARYAEMLSAIGTEPRLRIMRLLLSAHPGGMIVRDIQVKLGIPGSTLSHHLEKLKSVGLAAVHREHTCLHYSANTETLRQLLSFLYQECCSKNRVFEADKIFVN